jgi:fucose permease
VGVSTGTESYHRDEITRRVFAGLAAFGFLNAVLGPALPYLRSIEHISYLTGALHQAAFAVGGGLAGALAARETRSASRGRVISVGLALAAVASLGVAFGAGAPQTIAAAFAMSLFGTSALVRMWALLADLHGSRRTIALTEGEVVVSIGSIVTPLLVGALAATVLTWRGAIVIGALGVAGSVLELRRSRLPAPRAAVGAEAHAPRSRTRIRPTLIVVFAIVALEFALSFWLATYLHDSLGVGRGAAALLVSALYAANLVGRVAASRAARHRPDATLLAIALASTLIGTPLLIAAHSLVLATVGIAVAGAGIGAMFPLTSSLHVASTPVRADTAVGEVLTIAALGQLAGPLGAGAVAQADGLRTGLIVLPALCLLGLVALLAHRRASASAARGA